MQYNYDASKDEFVENPSGAETGNITGNRIVVLNEGSPAQPDLRFRVQIDDFGNVLAAANRLVQRLVPTFVFPTTQPDEFTADTRIRLGISC